MVSRWCRYCGTENSADAKTCYRCGRSFVVPNQRQQQYAAAKQQKRTTMNWHSRRFLGLLISLCLILGVSIGIWVYLSTRPQDASSHQINEYLFKNPAGGTVIYHLPATPPVAVTWKNYHNQQDGYSIDYPSNWVQVKDSSNGHSGQAFYPPGTNLNENIPGGAKGIGFRWIGTSQLQIPTDSTITNLPPVTIQGVTGQLYTQASLGKTITAIFPSKGGSFILTGSADSDIFIYVFQHMLESLKFM
jgi:hypothetical protein